MQLPPFLHEIPNFIAGFGFFANLYVIYLVLYASPKSIKQYKYFMLVLSALDAVMVVLSYFVLKPRALMPVSVFIIDGWVKHLGFEVCNGLLHVYISLLFDATWMISLCIIYRFLSILLDPKYVNFMVSKTGVITIVSYLLIFNTILSYFFTRKYNPDPAFLQYLLTTDKGPELREAQANGGIILVYDTLEKSASFFSTIFFIGLATAFLVDVVCVVLVYRFLRTVRVLSDRQAGLHRQFIVALTIQAAYPAIAVVIPVISSSALRRIAPDFSMDDLFSALDASVILVLWFILKPQILLPSTVFVIDGWAKHLGFEVCNGLLHLFFSILFDATWMISLSILYRYLALLINPRYVNFMVSKNGVTAIVMFFLVYDTLISYFLTQKYNPDPVFLKYLQTTEKGPVITKALANGGIVLVYDTREKSASMFSTVLFSGLAIALAVDVVCVALVFRFLCSVQLIGDQQQGLHRQFIFALLIQAVYPSIAVVIPILGSSATRRLAPDLAVDDLYYFVANLLMSLMPAMNFFSTVFCIAPYRRRTIEIVMNIFCTKYNPPVAQPVAASSSSNVRSGNRIIPV